MNMAKKEGVPLTQRAADALELPLDVVMNLPRTVIIGNCDLVIENFKGVIDYDDSSFQINTRSGVVRVRGSDLTLDSITDESVHLKGTIAVVEFL